MPLKGATGDAAPFLSLVSVCVVLPSSSLDQMTWGPGFCDGGSSL